MQITINGGEDKIGKLIDHIPHKEAVLVKKQFVNMIWGCKKTKEKAASRKRKDAAFFVV